MADLLEEQMSDSLRQYWGKAQERGEAAIAAMRTGDAGLARTAARQAAQQARIVLQLLTNEKQVAPEQGAAAAANHSQ